MTVRRLVKPQGNPDGYDKDLVYQINECLKARDSVLDRLLSSPEMFAFAQGRTTGTGDVVTTFAVGGTLDIQGNNVALMFDKERSTDKYVGTAMMLEGTGRFPVIPASTAKSNSALVIRFYQDTGAIVNASTTVFNFMIWAVGPRE